MKKQGTLRQLYELIPLIRDEYSALPPSQRKILNQFKISKNDINSLERIHNKLAVMHGDVKPEVDPRQMDIMDFIKKEDL